MVDSSVGAFFLAFAIIVLTGIILIVGLSVAITSAIGMLVTNALGGHTYGMYVLASLSGHLFIFATYCLLDYTRWRYLQWKQAPQP